MTRSPESPVPVSRPPTLLRFPGLDTLRAIAILIVMTYHIGIQKLLPSVLDPVIAMGWTGVDLFFVLSGFLIGSQLLKPYVEGRTPSAQEFYARRAYRILPAYLVVLVLYYVVPMWPEAPGPSSPWPYLTFTWNLLLLGYPQQHAFSHVWSLCVEEHFYLLLPLLLFLLMKRPSIRRTVALLVGIVLGGIALRAWFLYHLILIPAVPDDERLLLMMKYLYYPTYSRLDGLVVGVGLALLRTFRPQWWRRLAAHGNALLLAGVAVTALAFWAFGFVYPSVDRPASVIVAFPLLALGFGLMVAAAVCPGGLLSVRIPGAKPLATLAFSLYLSHKGMAHVVHTLFPRATGQPDWRSAGTLALGCLAAGSVLYFLVERPFLQLRARRMDKAATAALVEREVRLDPGV